MGYTILMQWRYNSPNPTPLTDHVITRILEHYNAISTRTIITDPQLTHPSRCSLQIRTFRSTTAPSDSLAHHTPSSTHSGKLLTTIAYSQSVSTRSEAASTARDDVTYMVLDDRGEGKRRWLAERSKGKQRDGNATSNPDADTRINTNAHSDSRPADSNAKNEPSSDDFEILEGDPSLYAPPSKTPRSEEVNEEKSYEQKREARRQRRPPQQYQTLAVRPAAAVLPLLTNLLSPFVLGISKSARAAASTTAQHPTPTPLSGTPSTVQTLVFPALSAPHPPLVLSIHAVPNVPSLLILEGEWEGSAGPGNGNDEGNERGSSAIDAILREFLEGCLPNFPAGSGGERKFVTWLDSISGDGQGWEGIERHRRVTQLLTQTLREANVI